MIPQADILAIKDSIIYVNVEVFYDRTGNTLDLPAISVNGEILLPLVDYFTAHANARSLAWMEKVREAVKLFLKYSLASAPTLEFGRPREHRALPPYEHFQYFATALNMGTFGKDGFDPSGLCWLASSPNKVGRVIRHLTEYFTWIAEKKLGQAASSFNPPSTLSAHDQLILRAAYEHRRSKAFLGHLWDSAPTLDNGPQSVKTPRAPRGIKSNPPAFPDELLERLLFQGFLVNGRYKWRDILITLLLNGAGFRISEVMHLYLQDVVEDPAHPGRALVRIYHPSAGAAPSDWVDLSGKAIKGNRRDYLMINFSLKPRTELQTKAHAGWKGGTHDDAKKLYKQAHWFTPELGELFFRIWIKYVREVATIQRSHPFAFINLSGKDVGGMYKISRFEASHAAAVRRAGLVSASEQGLKELGMTPHGHRHGFAKRLERAQVPPKIIMRCLHHASIESQEVYTQPTNREFATALNAAGQRLHATVSCVPF